MKPMISTSSLPKAKLRTCDRCTLTAGEPIVVAVANPKDANAGRCGNPHACARRRKKLEYQKGLKAPLHQPVPR